MDVAYSAFGLGFEGGPKCLFKSLGPFKLFFWCWGLQLVKRPKLLQTCSPGERCKPLSILALVGGRGLMAPPSLVLAVPCSERALSLGEEPWLNVFPSMQIFDGGLSIVGFTISEVLHFLHLLLMWVCRLFQQCLLKDLIC